MEKIKFMTEDNEELSFFVLEQTRINGKNYLLVTESENDEEAECYVLKDMSADSDTEAAYEFVEDEGELTAVSKVFEELLEDVEFISEVDE